MAKQPIVTQDMLSCDVCLKEIPVSEAKMEEAADYVSYFFGWDCYTRWREAEKPSTPE